MQLKHLSNIELDRETKKAADAERSATLVVLWHLRENEKRMLYAERGHKDLKTYCVKELKMSEGAAWRRISAMRLLKELPEVESKIQSGELNLTQVCQAQTLFRAQPSTTEEKREVLSAIENQTTAVTERILAEKGPDIERPSRERAVKGGKVEVTLVLEEELLKQMDEIEILLGRKMTKLELVRYMTGHTLTALKKTQSATAERRRTASKTVSRVTVREVRQRDENRCQYRDPETGQQCDARHHLQMEHKIPRAKGGNNCPENLELLCPNHNRWRAVQEFGHDKMREYMASLD